MADAAPADASAPAPTTTDAGDAANGSEAANTAAETVDERDAEIEKWKKLSRQNETALRKTQAELDKAQQASMSEVEKAVAQAKAEARSETLAELQRERVADKVAIAAAGKMADPADAAALLGNLDEFIVSGEIDTKAINGAIDKLLQTKPYLAAKPGTGSGEGGPRGNNGGAMPLNGDPLQQALEHKLGIGR